MALSYGLLALLVVLALVTVGTISWSRRIAARRRAQWMRERGMDPGGDGSRP